MARGFIQRRRFEGTRDSSDRSGIAPSSPRELLQHPAPPPAPPPLPAAALCPENRSRPGLRGIKRIREYRRALTSASNRNPPVRSGRSPRICQLQIAALAFLVHPEGGEIVSLIDRRSPSRRGALIRRPEEFFSRCGGSEPSMRAELSEQELSMLPASD
jgi:hypothetical protein